MMRHAKTSAAVFRRALVALVCAFALTLGLAGHGQARGAHAAPPIPSAALPQAVSQAAPGPAAPAATICPYATLAAGALSQQGAPHLPGAAVSTVRYGLYLSPLPASTLSGVLLRPPRTA